MSGTGNKPLTKPAHALTYQAVIEEIQADNDAGLTQADAKERLQVYGPNDLGDGAGVQPAKILPRQVANAMTLVTSTISPFVRWDRWSTGFQVLIMAMAVSFGIESWIEGGVITAVIVLNIVVGFWWVERWEYWLGIMLLIDVNHFRQEFNAEKTMDSLKSLSSPTASVVRNSENITVATMEIVPGDMVELKTGDTIPADLRVVFLSHWSCSINTNKR
jgi:Na+-exporting ATPase